MRHRKHPITHFHFTVPCACSRFYTHSPAAQSVMLRVLAAIDYSYCCCFIKVYACLFVPDAVIVISQFSMNAHFCRRPPLAVPYCTCMLAQPESNVCRSPIAEWLTKKCLAERHGVGIQDLEQVGYRVQSRGDALRTVPTLWSTGTCLVYLAHRRH